MIDISVIVTIYNLELYIRDCLDSILKQVGVDYEIICIDDASTDTSEDILKEYERKDSRIKVYRNSHNMGLASSRNRGYRHAKGEYLYNIDGDDVLAEGALHKMFCYSKKYNLDLLAFSAKAFWNEEGLCESLDADEYVRKNEYPGVYEGPKLFALLLKNGDRAIANRVLYCYKRNFFLENNLFDKEGLRYVDDSMFSYYLTAKRVMCIPDQLYLRRYRKGSIVLSPLKKRYLESMVVLFNLELERWRKAELNEEINYQIEAYFDLRLKEIYRLQMMFLKEQSENYYLQKHPADNYFYRRFIKNEPLYLNSLSDIQLEKIKQAGLVILYGAGYIASIVAEILDYWSIVDYMVAVTVPEDNVKIFRGRKVNSITKFCNIKDSLVIVAMSKKNEKDINTILYNNGLDNIVWVTLN